MWTTQMFTVNKIMCCYFIYDTVVNNIVCHCKSSTFEIDDLLICPLYVVNCTYICVKLAYFNSSPNRVFSKILSGEIVTRFVCKPTEML